METKNNSSPLISVVVCTYNRVIVLKDVLQTLAAQTLDDSFFELIIVDNNSSDGTDKVAKEFCSNHQNARYIMERQQGLSYARNRGWQEGRGEYIAYVDDDCKIPNQFIKTAKSIIEKEAPIVFGGPAFAFYNSEKPYWYKDAYGSYESFSEARVLKKDECKKIYGMNMFFRRFALENVGGFDPKLGMIGNKIAYCEETDLILRITENDPDYKFYYDPELYVYHLVQQERMSVIWFVKAIISLGRYSVFYSEMDLPLNADRLMLSKMLVKQGVLIAKDIARGILKRDRERYNYFQNYVFERTCNHLYKFGRLYGHFLQIKAR